MEPQQPKLPLSIIDTLIRPLISIMKVVALVSGGKDSCFSMMKCVEHGHEIVALATLKPPVDPTKVEIKVEIEAEPLVLQEEAELDSHMFQSIGTSIVRAISTCMQVPLITRELRGKSLVQELHYDQPVDGDEVEDLFHLLQDALVHFPDITGVCSGAIFSTYQRLRVEHVCARLGLTSLCYLWQREQRALLDDMIDSEVSSVVIKVASFGLKPKLHLGRTLQSLRPFFHDLHDKFQFHVCGEGGEYETLTLDCPLFRHYRIVIDDSEIISLSEDDVAYLSIRSFHLEEKSTKAILPWNAANARPVPIVSRSRTRLTTLPRESHAQTLHGQVPLPTTHYTVFHDQMYLQCRTSASAGSIQDQVTQVFESLQLRLLALDSSFDDMLYVHLYIPDMSEFQAINAIYCQYFGHSPASRSCVAIPGKELIVIGVVERGSGEMKRTCVARRDVLHVQSISSWAPTCIGPYAQANVSRSSLLWLAGQIGLVPETMSFASHPSLLSQELDQTVHNVHQILDALDSGSDQYLGCVVYTSSEASAEGCRHSFSRQCRNVIQSTSVFPLLHLGVSVLPREAKVEAEVMARTTKLAESVPIQYFEQHELQHSYMDRIASYFIRPFSILESPDRDIVQSMIDAIHRARLTIEHIQHLRIFYVQDNDNGSVSGPELEQRYQEAIAECSGARPLVVAIPVEWIGSRAAKEEEEEMTIAIQLVAFDLDQLETQMWIHHEID